LGSRCGKAPMLWHLLWFRLTLRARANCLTGVDSRRTVSTAAARLQLSHDDQKHSKQCALSSTNMVLLTMTSSIVEALIILGNSSEHHDPPSDSTRVKDKELKEPCLKDHAVGNTI